MTTYNVIGGGTAGAGTVAISPGTWPIRIVKIDNINSNSSFMGLTAAKYPASTVSGGTAIPIMQLQQGAPAATATARHGSVTFTPTTRNLVGYWLIAGAPATTLSDGITVVQVAVSGSAWQPPIDMVINPGGVFQVGLDTTGYTLATVYFEELRLNWST